MLALLGNISSRKREAQQTVLKVVELDEKIVDPAIWGRNFPRQYDGYLRTADNYGTKYGGAGSEGAPVSRLGDDPRLKTIFDGYAFAIDFNQRRGHAYMLDDQRVTKRVTERPQPGACLHCHDPRTMQLRVTKPGFIGGIAALAASSEPVPHLPSVEKWRKGDRAAPYDANRDASRQEMRSYVCGQCHVEYYCGPKTTLFFPWNKGLKVEQIEATYDDYKFPDGKRFFDWKHAKTGAELLKAQHPEFEMWSQGIHARSGVSCADCHMPYKREGAMKISDHHVRSPLLDVNRSCQTCHRFPEEELKARVAIIQDRTHALMSRAEDALVALINDLEAARKAGLDEKKLEPVYALQRKAQWRVDYVNAENSMGFHAPQEAARILGEAIDFGRQGQLALKELKAK